MVPTVRDVAVRHELTQAGVYQDRDDPSRLVRLGLLDRAGNARDLDHDALDAAGDRRGGRATGYVVRPQAER